jgi:hypothetical protein
VSWLGDLLTLYGRVFRRGAVLAVRNWTLALVVVVYEVALTLFAAVVAPLEFVGGVLVTIAMAALASSALVLLEAVVRTGRASWSDIGGSFATYLGDVVNVFFLLFVLRLVIQVVAPPGSPVPIVLELAIVVFLNAVPEMLYLGRQGGLALAVESYRFIGENWIEWFPPTAALYVLWRGVANAAPAGPLAPVGEVVASLVVVYGFVVRGLLFIELTTSSRRGRAFQRRASG